MRMKALAVLCAISMPAFAGVFPAGMVASTPLITIDVSRPTGCTAPCAEFFSAIGTTSPQTGNPYHDIQYRWDFGDTAYPSATWGYGSRANVSLKNEAYGANAAHVYEAPGTYTACVHAHDGVNTTQSCTSVVVDDPEVTFAGTKTLCVYNTTLGTGCPSGADTLATSNFNTAMQWARLNGPHKPYSRVLFKRGDAFTTATGITYVLWNGPGLIGAYGSGAVPTVTATDASVTILQIGKSGEGPYSDWRVMDLELIGNGTDNGVQGVMSLNAANQLTLLRLNVHGMNKGLFVSGVAHDQVALVDNVVTNVTGAGGSMASFLETARSATMGNSFDNGFGGEHAFRVQACYQCVVSNNTMQGAGAAAGSKHAFTLRSAVHNLSSTWANNGDAQYIVMSDNKFIGSPGGAWTVFNGPQASDDERLVDTIFERNWIQAGSGQTEALHFAGHSRNTIRANVFDLSGASSHVGVKVSQYSTTVYPDTTWIYNNTFYSSDTSNNFSAVDVTHYVTNTVVKNNLAYAPNDSAHAVLTCDGYSDLTPCVSAPMNLIHGDNSASALTSPLFTSVSPFSPSGAKPTCSGTTYPCGQGDATPLWSDFFLVPISSGRDIGAVQH